MKLTREQVSQLSDLELNRGMAWLFAEHVAVTILGGGTYKYTSGISDRNGTNLSIFAYDNHESIDFLTDYNLTMPLVISNNVWLQPDCMGDGFKHAYDDNFSAKSKVPIRAICEVLLMIAMEREA